MEDIEPFSKEEEESHLKKLFTWFIIPLVVMAAIRLLKDNRNLFFILLATLIVIVFAALGWVSKKTKIKALFFAVAFFFCFHLLIFPLLYSSLLKRDATCIIINRDILSNEKNYALSELTTEYLPETKAELIKLITQILSNAKTVPDTPLIYLKDNIIILDSFLVSNKDTSIITGHEPGQGHTEQTILIFTKNGSLITSLYEKRLYNNYYKKSKLFEYLTIYKDYYSHKIGSYSSEKNEIINKNKIWSYTTILPYSINIFTTDNFKPISRTANIIYNIHYYLVWGLILAIIISTITDLISIKLKK